MCTEFPSFPPQTGLKPQLIARLTKVLKTEETDASAMDDQDESSPAAVEAEPEEQLKATDEFDMNDIVVIDEYDSTKPKSNKSTAQDPPKPMEERERRLIEKRYQLPENPELIVHPSRTAKSGKFFCNEMSLSILLDYRPEDSKEHSFEVSLFAELFNEMLMRDFGFNIYKTLYDLPEKEEEKEKEAIVVKKDAAATDSSGKKNDESAKDEVVKKDEETKDDTDGNDAPVSANDDKDDDTKSTTAAPEDKAKDKGAGDDKDSSSRKSSIKDRDRSDKDRRKRGRGEETDDDTYSTRSGDPKRKDKDRQKYITINPELLLSFVYFDQTHCGYILEKDIEDLFYTLGLSLSRAQARKLASKVVTRDSLFYRYFLLRLL